MEANDQLFNSSSRGIQCPLLVSEGISKLSFQAQFKKKNRGGGGNKSGMIVGLFVVPRSQKS